MKRLITLPILLALASFAAFGQRVRVIHASPDAPAVDISVDGTPALDHLPFGQWTDYTSVPAGQRIFQVYVAGTTTKVAEANVNINPGQDYTVIASGYATPEKAPGLRLILLQDSNFTAAEGQSRVRVVHAAPGAPAVDVYAEAPYAALKDKTPILTNVPFGVGSGYLTVPATRNYAARVVPTGTKTIAIDSGRVMFPSGGAVTVIAVDNKGGGAPFGFLVVRDR